MKTHKNKNIKNLLNNNGLSIIPIIIVLASVSFVLFQGLEVFFTKGRKTKAVNELTISAKTFTNGLFNYTLFAIKERWCMDKNWGKDEKCSTTGNMDEAISSALNLERLLWAQSTEIDIKERYLKIYKKYPTVNPRLNKMTHSITIAQLEELGRSHPLNLIIDENIRRCIDKIDIEIEKQNPSIIKPQGDEVYLQIGILGKGKFASFSNCSSIASSLNLRGLVVVYPRTLNQFSLIKAKDLDLTKFGSSSGSGINFYGPVYVQGDFIIPSKTKKVFNFRDSVVIGEGIFKNDNSAFVPGSYGHSSSTFLGQISSVKGIHSGVALDAEIDAGISKIFGNNYKYPQNTNMAACKARQVLKDNFTMTKDSRLFFKKNGNGLTMALSHDNEFRERAIRGSDANGFNVRFVDSTLGGNNNNNNIKDKIEIAKLENKPSASYTKNKKDDLPIMEVDLKINDQYTELPLALLGRNTDLKVELVNQEFYKSKLAVLSTSSSNYLDINDLELGKLGSNTNNFKSAYNNFYSSCNNNLLRSKVTIPSKCQRVMKDIPEVIAAPTGGNNNSGKGNSGKGNSGKGNSGKGNNVVVNSSYDDEELESSIDDSSSSGSSFVSNPSSSSSNVVVGTCQSAYPKGSNNFSECEDALKSIDEDSKEYFNRESALKNSVGQLAQNVPAVEIKTAEVASNAENLNINVINSYTMNNMLLDHLKSLSIDIKAYDFAIENSPNNTENGQRSKKVELPGPNDSGSDKSNKLIVEFLKGNNGGQNYRLMTNDGQEVIKKNNGNWAILKKDVKALDVFQASEPPGNRPFGEIIYPQNAMSVAAAKKLDKDCDVDTAAAIPPSWDVSFTDMTSFSWLYNITSSGVAITDPSKAKPLDTYVFDSANNDMTIGFYSGVPTRSIVNNCIIKENINFVFGFYVCKNLRIEARTSTLNIVGTFIVNDLMIDSSAANAGVNFYNIWQKEAIALLQQKKHLKRENSLAASGSNACSSMKTAGWNPYLDTDTLADTMACSPVRFLYQGANNFNWTTVDPELGIASNNTFVATTQAKVANRYRRYGVNVLWQREDYK